MPTPRAGAGVPASCARPGTTAPGFGLPSRPSGDGFLIVRGIRDVVLALALGILLVTGHEPHQGTGLTGVNTLSPPTWRSCGR